MSGSATADLIKKLQQLRKKKVPQSAEDVPLGSGLADQAGKELKNREENVDSIVDAAVRGKKKRKKKDDN